VEVSIFLSEKNRRLPFLLRDLRPLALHSLRQVLIASGSSTFPAPYIVKTKKGPASFRGRIALHRATKREQWRDLFGSGSLHSASAGPFHFHIPPSVLHTETGGIDGE